MTWEILLQHLSKIDPATVTTLLPNNTATIHIPPPEKYTHAVLQIPRTSLCYQLDIRGFPSKSIPNASEGPTVWLFVHHASK
jgi:hypothetical protein